MENFEDLRISLQDIKLATNDFSYKNMIGQGGFGVVYKGELPPNYEHRKVAVKMLSCNQLSPAPPRDFMTEIVSLASCQHKNVASLVGFCQEGGHNLLVYKFESRGSLDKHLTATSLSWTERLKICIGVARGLNYLHSEARTQGLISPKKKARTQGSIIHRDIKSANVLLDDDWTAKISDFGLAKMIGSQFGVTNITNPCGTPDYLEPEYVNTGIVTKESDVYSLGVVLFEILCGKLVGGRQFIARAQACYEEDGLDDIIDPELRKQMELASLTIFSNIAYQCLKVQRRDRPTMSMIVEALGMALEHQQAGSRIMKTEKWGGQGGNRWFFFLEKNCNLRKITIDHKDWIYSVIFTAEESDGKLHPSKMFGGEHDQSGNQPSEINLEVDEKIIGIKGTLTRARFPVVESLSFETNKRTHGPFGPVSGVDFSVSCEDFALAGFYGLACWYVDSIGLYLKASILDGISITRSERCGGPGGTNWSFPLQSNNKLRKITIDHKDWIYSIKFTVEDSDGKQHPSKMFGGEHDQSGNPPSEINFDDDEKIQGIKGTLTRGELMVVESLFFITNKKIHGPYGRPVSGIEFSKSCEDFEFAGFYGYASWYVDSIGFILKKAIYIGNDG